jgi:hypothetical protein
MTRSEPIVATGDLLVDRVGELLREGNARRIVVRQGDRTVAEFPLTVGVVGAALTPALAAVGVLAALVADCAIEIERGAAAEVVVSSAPTWPNEADEALEM